MIDDHRERNLSPLYCTREYFLYYLGLHETYMMAYAVKHKRSLFNPGYGIMYGDEIRRLMRLINE